MHYTCGNESDGNNRNRKCPIEKIGVVTFEISEPRVAYIINCRPRKMVELERERVSEYFYDKICCLTACNEDL